MEALKALDVLKAPMLALDPCVGADAIPRAWDAFLPETMWCKLDIRSTGVCGLTVCNYLAWKPTSHFDVAIFNPPFSKALQFVAHAMEHARMVLMLQRLDWLASEDRQPFLQENTPSTFVLPNRIDFDGRGGDMRDYGWFGWGVEEVPRVHILDKTPLEVRKAQKGPRRPDYQLGLAI